MNANVPRTGPIGPDDRREISGLPETSVAAHYEWPPSFEETNRTGSPASLTPAPVRIALTLLSVVICLAAASATARFSLRMIPEGHYGVIREIAAKFDMDCANTVPAWYSSAALLATAGLLGFIGATTHRRGAPFAFHWFVLAAGFLLLAVDQSAGLYELVVVPVRRHIDLQGTLYYAWVVPGAVAAIVIGLSYLTFLFHLPRRTWVFMSLAGLLFVIGAFGSQLPGGVLAEVDWILGSRGGIAMATEEVLKMLGTVVFLYALLDYITTHFGQCRVRFVKIKPTGAIVP